MNILLIEDTESIIKGLTYSFEKNNYKIAKYKKQPYNNINPATWHAVHTVLRRRCPSRYSGAPEKWHRLLCTKPFGQRLRKKSYAIFWVSGYIDAIATVGKRI